MPRSGIFLHKLGLDKTYIKLEHLMSLEEKREIEVSVYRVEFICDTKNMKRVR